MAYNLSWFLHQRIVYLYNYDSLTGEEIAESTQNIVSEYFKTGIAPIHVLIDMRDVKELPVRVVQFKKATDRSFKDPNIGWVVVVGSSNPMVRFLFSTLAQIAGIKFGMVNTLDEALNLLGKMDPSVGELIHNPPA